MQTVPSLALFGFLIPIPLIGGIGKRTAIVALVLYALLPILRNTLAGILGVDPAVRESAVAMGMTPRQVLWQVELPLSARTILAGIRIATVTTIGAATIAAAIGGGGLGVFIFRGIASVDTQQILAGAIPAALIALAADALWAGWNGEWPYEAHRLLSLLLLSARAAASIRITVGSKNFTEQVMLGEIVAQHLEHRLGEKVDRKLNLGGTLLAHQALVKGSIDVYPEYTGTALTDYSEAAALDRCGRRAGDRARRISPAMESGLARSARIQQYLRDGDPRRRRARPPGSHAERCAGYQPGWMLGVGYEFLQRPDGLPGLLKTYPLRLASPPVSMDLGLLYQALGQNKVDMVAGSATDGMLSVLDVVVLEDDHHFFPPYQAALVVRKAGAEAIRVSGRRWRSFRVSLATPSCAS